MEEAIMEVARAVEGLCFVLASGFIILIIVIGLKK